MGNQLKNIVVLGSTGSIGRQTLEVISAFPDRFNVIGLAAGENIALLTEQVARFKPRFAYDNRKDNKPPIKGIDFISPAEMAGHPDVDIVVIALPGGAGLEPTLAAVKAGKKIALANKESLVTAGGIIMELAKESGAQILPVDSEHSAIWQCLEGEKGKASHIILTASGGPFLNYSKEELGKVTPGQALKHPSWKMGKKVTIDSATLMNKGLEIIEAHWLFNMPYDKISVIIHPQSIVHSMVEFAGGAVKAQLSPPDMRLPIQYALTYPERLVNEELPRIKWEELKKLDFEQPDTDRFPCLRIGREAGEKGGTYPAVLCGADESAVELFLSGKIRFTGIPQLVERVLDMHSGKDNPSIEEIRRAEKWAYEAATGCADRGGEC